VTPVGLADGIIVQASLPIPDSWPAVCSLHGHAPFDIMSRSTSR
jgi:hypothetical protein